VIRGLTIWNGLRGAGMLAPADIFCAEEPNYTGSRDGDAITSRKRRQRRGRKTRRPDRVIDGKGGT